MDYSSGPVVEKLRENERFRLSCQLRSSSKEDLRVLTFRIILIRNNHNLTDDFTK